MIGRATVPVQEVTVEPGGAASMKKRPQVDPSYKPIGILYCKQENGVIDFRVVYEGHITDKVKEEVAARFGAGAIEWNER